MTLRTSSGLVAAALLTLVSTAKADTISYNGNFSVSNTVSSTSLGVTNGVATSTTVNLNQFNTALGTLTGIQIIVLSNDEAPRFDEVTVGVNVTGTRTNVGGSSALTLTGTAIGSILLPGTAPDSNPNFTFSPSSQICGTTGANGTCSAGNTSPVAPLPSYTTVSFLDPAFSGPGQFAVTLELVANQNLSRNNVNINANSASVTALWQGNAQVIYTYDPVASPVPEPSTVSLVAGAALMGLYSIRRRKASK